MSIVCSLASMISCSYQIKIGILKITYHKRSLKIARIELYSDVSGGLFYP